MFVSDFYYQTCLCLCLQLYIQACAYCYHHKNRTRDYGKIYLVDNKAVYRHVISVNEIYNYLYGLFFSEPSRVQRSKPVIYFSLPISLNTTASLNHTYILLNNVCSSLQQVSTVSLFRPFILNFTKSLNMLPSVPSVKQLKSDPRIL